jgi:hypothetical protein
MGLNNSAMAHHPGDRYGIKNHAAFSKQIFFELSPDIVITPLYTLLPARADLLDYQRKYRDGFARRALRDLFRDPSFEATYTLAAIKRTGEPGRRLGGYFRNDYLEDLEANKNYNVRKLK